MLPAKRSAGWQVGLLVWISLALRSALSNLGLPSVTAGLHQKMHNL